ncbi:transposase [Amycolatopsis vastitatis]|uniref:transposase n=1 Tax=Amycolatopsis vastitatis TaxID=1905142 RepID=UPI0023E44495|nr:transposase [Amycolatopsis vastitatis]
MCASVASRRPSSNAGTNEPPGRTAAGPVDVHRPGRGACRRRNVVERCFNWLKRFRALATRFDKTATSYRGLIDLATLILWL